MLSYSTDTILLNLHQQMSSRVLSHRNLGKRFRTVERPSLLCPLEWNSWGHSEESAVVLGWNICIWSEMNVTHLPLVSATQERFAYKKYYKCAPQRCARSKWSCVMSFFVMNVQHMMINSSGILLIKCNQSSCNTSVGEEKLSRLVVSSTREARLCLSSRATCSFHVSFRHFNRDNRQIITSAIARSQVRSHPDNKEHFLLFFLTTSWLQHFTDLLTVRYANRESQLCPRCTQHVFPTQVCYTRAEYFTRQRWASLLWGGETPEIAAVLSEVPR